MFNMNCSGELKDWQANKLLQSCQGIGYPVHRETLMLTLALAITVHRDFIRNVHLNISQVYITNSC